MSKTSAVGFLVLIAAACSDGISIQTFDDGPTNATVTTEAQNQQLDPPELQEVHYGGSCLAPELIAKGIEYTCQDGSKRVGNLEITPPVPVSLCTAPDATNCLLSGNYRARMIQPETLVSYLGSAPSANFANDFTPADGFSSFTASSLDVTLVACQNNPSASSVSNAKNISLAKNRRVAAKLATSWIPGAEGKIMMSMRWVNQGTPRSGFYWTLENGNVYFFSVDGSGAWLEGDDVPYDPTNMNWLGFERIENGMACLVTSADGTVFNHHFCIKTPAGYQDQQNELAFGAWCQWHFTDKSYSISGLKFEKTP